MMYGNQGGGRMPLYPWQAQQPPPSRYPLLNYPGQMPNAWQQMPHGLPPGSIPLSRLGLVAQPDGNIRYAPFLNHPNMPPNQRMDMTSNIHQNFNDRYQQPSSLQANNNPSLLPYPSQQQQPIAGHLPPAQPFSYGTPYGHHFGTRHVIDHAIRPVQPNLIPTPPIELPIAPNPMMEKSIGSVSEPSGSFTPQIAASWLQLLNPAQKEQLSNLMKEQEEFEKVFANWEKEFEKWRQQNQHHPDRTAYMNYSQQWDQWKQRLLDRREQMKTLIDRTIVQLKKQVFPNEPSSNINTEIHQVVDMNIDYGGNFAQPPPPPSSPPPPPPPPPPPSQDDLRHLLPSSLQSFQPIPVPKPRIVVTIDDDDETDDPNVNSYTLAKPIPDYNESSKHNSQELNASKDSSIDERIRNLPDFEKMINDRNRFEIDEINQIEESRPDEENETKLLSDIMSTSNSSNSLLKAAQALIFIQRKQHLLKSIEEIEQKIEDQKGKPILNLNQQLSKDGKSFRHLSRNSSPKSNSDIEFDIQSAPFIDPASKPFNVDEVMAKMKSIQPPGSAQANELVNTIHNVANQFIQNSKPNFSNSPYKSSNFHEPAVSERQNLNQSNNSGFSTAPLNELQNPIFNPVNTVTDSLPKNLYSENSDYETRRSQSSDLIQDFPSTQDNGSFQDTRRDFNSHYQQHDTPTTSASRNYVAKTIDYAHRPSSTSSQPSSSVQDYDHRKSYDQQLDLDNRGKDPSYSIPRRPYSPHRDRIVIDHSKEPHHFYDKSNSRTDRLDSERSLHPLEKRNFHSAPRNLSPKPPLTYKDSKYFTDPPSSIVSIEDLIKPPSRESRPSNILIILRGLPGSGKTYFAKLVKDKEVEYSNSAPRILSLDDYFMVEKEKTGRDEDTGRQITVKEFVYEYENEMEKSYRLNLLKAFKKTVDDGYFQFIIIDAVNECISNFDDFYSYANKKGFTVYVAEMETKDAKICHQQNIHNRELEDIRKLRRDWQPTPRYMLKLDILSFLQNASIEDVEMETVTIRKRDHDSSSDYRSSKKSHKSSHSDTEEEQNERVKSRWEKMEEASGEKKDRLDAFKMKRKITMDEYLQLPDDYEDRIRSRGQKRVRWVDIEERKNQERLRQRGFVVGQDWDRVMDPHHPDKALNRTKYF